MPWLATAECTSKANITQVCNHRHHGEHFDASCHNEHDCNKCTAFCRHVMYNDESATLYPHHVQEPSALTE